MPTTSPSKRSRFQTKPHQSQHSRHAHVPRRLSPSLRNTLLRFYDYPHPQRPHVIIEGYDIAHARRTASMCIAVAKRLDHPLHRIRQYEIACLLHDLGRAGLDQQLFGKIWSWAKRQGIPTRPREWRTRHPKTLYGEETEAFLELYGKELARQGISLDSWTKAQIEMRLGFARRLRRQLRIIKPQLKTMGIHWTPWMEHVMLYYYYPEKLICASRWVRQLAEILVACEQLEAYNNQLRGRDYYARSKESLIEAFRYLERLRNEGVISEQVLSTIRMLMTHQSFTKLLIDARGKNFTRRELRYIEQLQKDSVRCQ